MSRKVRSVQLAKAGKVQPKILVSACLVGQCVRYKGDSCPQNLLLAPQVRKYLLPFCPECAGGLALPARLRKSAAKAAVKLSGRAKRRL